MKIKSAKQKTEMKNSASEIMKLRSEMAKGFKAVQLKLSEHDKRFDEHDKRFDEHDKRFDEIDKTLKAHSKTLESHSKTLESHSKMLESHSKMLESHSKMLESHSKTLESHSKTLEAHSKTLESHSEYFKQNAEEHSYFKKSIDALDIRMTKGFNEINIRFDKLTDMMLTNFDKVMKFIDEQRIENIMGNQLLKDQGEKIEDHELRITELENKVV